MLFNFRRLRIKVQLAILSILVLLIIILLIIYSYQRFAHVIEQKNLQANQNLVRQIKQSQQEIFDLLDKMIFNLTYSTDVQAFLLEQDPVKRLQYARNVYSLMNNLTTLRDGIQDIVVIGENGDKLTFKGNSANVHLVENFITDTSDNNDKLYVSELLACPGSSVLTCMLLKAPIYSTDSSGPFYRHIGMVGMLVDARTLTGVQEELLRQRDVILSVVDRKGQLIASNGQTFIPEPDQYRINNEGSYMFTMNKQQYLAHWESIPLFDGYLTILTPLTVLHAELRHIRNDQLLIVTLSLIFLSLLLGYIIRNIVKPLRDLLRFMQDIKLHTGAMSRRIDLDGYAEIGVVASHFNGMLNELQQLTDENVSMNIRMIQNELERKNAQYHFLKSQINPHFLYNTLETIKGLAIINGVPEIRDIAKAMGNMFRYAIKGEDDIPLFKEINIMESYFQIQRFRFQDRFETELRLDEKTMSYPVPKMVLQPLVENAIYHGLEPKLGKGRLVVSSDIENGTLVLAVEDNGVGISEEKLVMLQRSLASMDVSNIEENRGVGLVNVHRRIQLKYGTDYGLTVDSKEGEGTRMTITLPVSDV